MKRPTISLSDILALAVGLMLPLATLTMLLAVLTDQSQTPEGLDRSPGHGPLAALLGSGLAGVVLCGGLLWQSRQIRRALERQDAHAADRQRQLETLAATLAERDAQLHEFRKRAARFRALAETAADAIICADTEGCVTVFNEAAERLFGIRRDNAVGRPVREFLPQTTHNAHARLGAEALAEGKSLLIGKRLELLGRTVKGEPFPAEVSLSTYQVAGRLEFAAIVRDIRDRHAAAEKLRESESLARSIIASLEEGVIVTDARGVIQSVNRAAETILGRSANQIVGMAISDPSWQVLREDGRPMPSEEFPSVVTLRTGRTRTAVVVGIARPDRQTRWLSVSSCPLLSMDHWPPQQQPMVSEIDSAGDLSGAAPAVGESKGAAFSQTASPTEVSHGPAMKAPRGVVMSFSDITWRREGEETLRRSESQYRLLFDAHPLPMWVYETESAALMAVNHTACQRYGYTREEFLAMTLADLSLPEEVPRLMRSMARAAQHAGGQLEAGPWRHRRRDGSCLEVTIHSHPLTFRGRSARLVYAEDITERLRAEQALRQSRQLYHSLVETLPAAIFRKDSAGRFTFVNQRFADLAGTAPDLLLGKTDADIAPPELATKYRADDLCVMTTGRTLSLVEEHHSRQLGRRFVQVIKTPLPADWQHHLSGPMPLTAHGLAPRSTGHAPWPQSPSCAPDEMASGPDGPGASCSGVQGMFWDITETKQLEDELRRRSDQLEAANHRLRATQAAMIQQEKLAGLGQLTAGVAHEINNPLAFVVNNLAVLERDLAELMAISDLYRQAIGDLEIARPQLAAEIRRRERALQADYALPNIARLIDSTKGGIERVRRIVADLRQFSRLDSTAPEPLDIDQCLRLTLGIIGHEIRRREITVLTEWGGLTEVWGYPQKLNQVFLNLLVNALQASEPGCQLRVRTYWRDTDPTNTPHQPGQGPANRQAVIEIIDQGCGIPDDIRDRIFDPFFTTKPPGEGTGLGLSICYGIVVGDHGGAIELDSHVASGTTFRVVLPLQGALPPDGDSLSPLPHARVDYLGPLSCETRPQPPP